MSWGYRITIITLGFVGFMSFLVTKAFQQKFDLVADDYYARELRFEDQIQKQQNQSMLKETIQCMVLDDHLVIKFPSELNNSEIKGELYFFNPSDESKDVKVSINTNAAGVQLIDKNSLQKGSYRLQVDYASNGSSFYDELRVSI